MMAEMSVSAVLNSSYSIYVICVPLDSHSFSEVEAEVFQGMNSWRCDSRDTQGNQKMNS